MKIRGKRGYYFVADLRYCNIVVERNIDRSHNTVALLAWHKDLSKNAIQQCYHKDYIVDNFVVGIADSKVFDILVADNNMDFVLVDLFDNCAQQAVPESL